MITTNILFEVTDTFGGEANYSWVKRGTIECKEGEDYSDLAAVRRVKKAIGWNGVRCITESDGNSITLRPIGINQVCFINFLSFGRCPSKGEQ